MSMTMCMGMCMNMGMCIYAYIYNYIFCKLKLNLKLRIKNSCIIFSKINVLFHVESNTHLFECFLEFNINLEFTSAV